MRSRSTTCLAVLATLAVVAALACDREPVDPIDTLALAHGEPGPPNGGESEGNNLSFPVIFSDGVPKILRGDFNAPSLIEAELVPAADGTMVYPQQAQSTWQAQSLNLSGGPILYVDGIDWGDNLESVPWYLNSKVRTEIVLLETLAQPMVAFDMRHISGLGMDELWGTTGSTYESTEATVYSYCARLLIQKLQVPRENVDQAALEWVPGTGWVGEQIAEALVNKPIWLGGDGPGYYSAEINVKGKIIYGYNWDVKKANDGEGDYRITFALEAECGVTTLNTFFDENTIIKEPAEEVAAIEEEPSGEGGLTYLDYERNLTYIDLIIKEGKGNGGKGGKGGGGNGGNGGVGNPGGGNH